MLDLGLKLAELFQVRASKLSEGKILVPCCRWDNTWRCGVACSLAKWGTVAYPRVLIIRSWHPEPDVEALSSWIISAFIIGVGVAEAVVACDQEEAHSLGSRSLEKSALAHATSSSEESVWV